MALNSRGINPRLEETCPIIHGGLQVHLIEGFEIKGEGTAKRNVKLWIWWTGCLFAGKVWHTADGNLYRKSPGSLVWTEMPGGTAN
jgi:hypothetical protein